MSFAVVRHPDVTVAGVLPEEALEFKRVQGWYRVSEFANAPADLDPAAYGPDSPDLDAPEPEPVPVKKTKTAKAAETTSEEQE
jgi:hypothetical protein